AVRAHSAYGAAPVTPPPPPTGSVPATERSRNLDELPRRDLEDEPVDRDGPDPRMGSEPFDLLSDGRADVLEPPERDRLVPARPLDERPTDLGIGRPFETAMGVADDEALVGA